MSGSNARTAAAADQGHRIPGEGRVRDVLLGRAQASMAFSELIDSALGRRPDDVDAEFFAAVVATAVEDHGINATQIAHAIGASRSSVSRWASGVLAPRAEDRVALLKWLARRARKRASEFETEAESIASEQVA